MTEMANGEKLRKRIRRYWRFSMVVLVAVLYLVTVTKFYDLNSMKTLLIPLPKPLAPVQRALKKAVIANTTSAPPTKAPPTIQHLLELKETVIANTSSPLPTKAPPTIQHPLAIKETVMPNTTSPPPTKAPSPPIQHPLSLKETVMPNTTSPPPTKAPPTIQHPLSLKETVIPNTSSPLPTKAPPTIQHPLAIKETIMPNTTSPPPTKAPPTIQHPLSLKETVIPNTSPPLPTKAPPTIQHPLAIKETVMPNTTSPPPTKAPPTIQHPLSLKETVIPNTSSPLPTKAPPTIQHPLAIKETVMPNTTSPPPTKAPPTIQHPLAIKEMVIANTTSPPPTKAPPTIQHPLSLKETVIPNTSSAPTKATSRIQRPYYLQECYTYEDLRARFTCNDTHSFRNFTHENIFECASSLWEVIRDKSIPDPWGNPAVAVSKKPSVHLVMAGDSHIRNVFEVFLRRIAGPRVKYRVAKMQPDEWKDSENLFATWKLDAHEFFHELLHLDVPLRITFYWDPFLETLPQLLSSWTAGNDRKPTHLLIGSTLHYMRRTSAVFLGQGQKAASMQFFNHLKTISPQLEKLSNTTPVVFKLQDHLQKDPRNNIENPQNIDYYNRIASDLLPKSSSSFVVWNSTVPLSDLYAEECLKKGSSLPRTVDWRCDDVKHLGYKVIDQYLDMYLNDICCCFGKGGMKMT